MTKVWKTLFLCYVSKYTRGVDFKIKPSPLRFLKIAFFLRSFKITFDGSTFELILIISISKFKILNKKWSFESLKNWQKDQIYVLTKHKVIWVISKLIKIRDQGMEILFFVLCFKICPCGVDLEILMPFLCFLFLVLFSEKLAHPLFWGQALNLF